MSSGFTPCTIFLAERSMWVSPLGNTTWRVFVGWIVCCSASSEIDTGVSEDAGRFMSGDSSDWTSCSMPRAAVRQLADAVLDPGAERAIESRRGVREVLLEPDPGVRAKLIEEVPHRSARAAAEEAETAATGLAGVERGLHVGPRLADLHAELLHFLVGERPRHCCTTRRS